jgi:hypothetical protein
MFGVFNPKAGLSDDHVDREIFIGDAKNCHTRTSGEWVHVFEDEERQFWLFDVGRIEDETDHALAVRLRDACSAYDRGFRQGDWHGRKRILADIKTVLEL